MTSLCSCAKGHTFTRDEAKKKNYRCDVDGTTITCPAESEANATGHPRDDDGTPNAD